MFFSYNHINIFRYNDVSDKNEKSTCSKTDCSKGIYFGQSVMQKNATKNDNYIMI